MKINLAKSAGFCFGVKRALGIARQTAGQSRQIFMLGDIVHNEDVVREIEKSGIKKIKRLSKGRGSTLLIRAHGAAKETFSAARKLGYKIVDATCPMVKEIHKIAKHWERKGYKIIVIGDKKHDEVLGIVGQLKTQAIVIDKLKGINLSSMRRIKKAAIVAQSTQNVDKVLGIVRALKAEIEVLKYFNTICRTTINKQQEIKTMPLNNQVMIIIGSKTSANTKRLFEIAKSLNQKSYWIQSEKQIKSQWFKAASSVGVTAGASTPDSTTCAVINKIRRYS